MIEQTKTRPQETLEFKKDKQMQIFSLNPPINLVEKGKWLLGVTSFERTNSVFKLIDENNSVSIIIPGCWRIPDYLDENIIDELKKLLKLKSEKIFESRVEEVRKRGTRKKIGVKEYKLSNFDTFKNEILQKIKKAK